MDIQKISGYRRNFLAFVLGVCATLTLAPFYVFPLIISAYGGLFLLVSGATSKKRAFADGWWWGWGFFISGLYWFCIALLTDPEKFGWAIPFCLLGLNAVIALYPALACLLYYLLTNREPRTINHGKCLVFSTIWLLTEYARGHLFTGFPWNLAGYSFGFSEVSLQLASVIGIYGLTFFAVLLGASAALIRSNKLFISCVWLCFAASLLFGYMRLENATPSAETGINIRVVQANIDKPHNFIPELQQKTLEQYADLTQRGGMEKIDYVIWPESSVPYILRSATPLAENIGSILPLKTKLITGALHLEKTVGDYHIYNAMAMLDAKGQVLGNYDKHALVPFGEFIPFRSLIPKGLNLPVGDKDFSSGVGAQTVNWDGKLKISPLVCYEAIFPEYAADDNNRPDLLLNITNDVWFGDSIGPYQHFAMARMRAVEQGIPMIRAANTGISAYIDEYGRIIQSIGLGKKDILDFELRKTQLSSTVYLEYKKILIQLLIVFMAICIIFCKKLTKN